MLYNLCAGLGMSAGCLLMGKEAGSGTAAAAILTSLDEKYLPAAEDMLKALLKAAAGKDKE